MVWPTMIGRIIEGRDQVFTTFFSLREFRMSIFSFRDFSTKGPFFTDLLIWTSSSATDRSLTDRCVFAFLRDELRRATRAGHELRPASGLQLDPVDLRSRRDVLERQAVADPRFGIRSRNDRVADPQVVRRDDVALLAVAIDDEREARRAIGVVFDRRHLRGDAVFVALEVDHAVVALLPAAAMARRDAALSVAAGVAQLALGEASLRLLALGELLERSGLAEAPDRRCRLVLLQRHLHALHEVLLDALAFADG